MSNPNLSVVLLNANWQKMCALDYESFAGIVGQGYVGTFEVDGKEYSATMEVLPGSCTIECYYEDEVVGKWIMDQAGVL